MLSRHFLRCKSLQALYAGVTSEAATVDEVLKIFDYNVVKLNELGVLQMSTLPHLTFACEKIMEASMQKFNPNESEKNPSRRFVDNRVIKTIEECDEFKTLSNRMKIDWSNYFDTFRRIYNTLKENKQYKQYMSAEVCGWEDDQAIALVAFKALMCDETLRAAIYDRDLIWEDDFDQIAQYNYMMLKDITENDDSLTLCPQVFDMRNEKDKADYNFARKLTQDTFNRLDDTEPLIRKHLNNWEMERVALMDILLINMAVTEFTCCPSIPERVTVDEYIELSKEFSTEKSKLFINGILDKLLIELRVAGKIEKDERGMYDPNIEE